MSGSQQTQGGGGNVAVSLFGYLAGLFFPILGFAIGLSQINRSRDGIWIIGVSCVGTLIWLAVLTG